MNVQVNSETLVHVIRTDKYVNEWKAIGKTFLTLGVESYR